MVKNDQIALNKIKENVSNDETFLQIIKPDLVENKQGLSIDPKSVIKSHNNDVNI